MTTSREHLNTPGAAPAVPMTGRLRPLGVREVRITGGFWAERQAVNAHATLDHCYSAMDRLGWIANFREAASGRVHGPRPGREFSDSEVYKLAEAMAWESARSSDATVDAAMDKLVTDIAAAQQPDGYLNTAFGRPGQPDRYSDLEWGHELYCHGHLIQAGVAQARVDGDGELVAIATRAADHICRTFGADGNDGLCGHPEIETALAELARVTGEQRYLDQAALFLSRRGRGRLADIHLGRSYYQDDMPVHEATVLRGHAVRALYLAAGAVDVAVETGDDALLEAVAAQWQATIARRTYVTGGMGSRHAGEAFGEDFELPADRAYSETCAGVASVMLSWRLLLATGDPRYADLIERTLYNVVSTSPAADGRAFFYANTLHQRQSPRRLPPDTPSPRPVSGLRASWFDVSCCPTNVSRMLASLSAYVATVDAGGLQIHQFADADIATKLGDGRPVGLQMRTGYPDGGAVTVTVTDPPPGELAVSLRIPQWASDSATVTGPDGRVTPVTSGTVEIRHSFTAGDVIRLELPVSPRWTVPDPRIDGVRGSIAVEQGPLVLCVESIDLPGEADVDRVWVDPGQEPVVDGDRVLVGGALIEPDHGGWPYRDAPAAQPVASGEVGIPLRPYHSWGERGPSTMRVWMPRI